MQYDGDDDDDDDVHYDDDDDDDDDDDANDNDDNDMKYGTKPSQLANKSATNVTIMSADNSHQEERSLRDWPTNLQPTLVSCPLITASRKDEAFATGQQICDQR